MAGAISRKSGICERWTWLGRALKENISIFGLN
jgi:hypothetical protein